MTTTEGISLPTNVKQTNVRHKMLANPSCKPTHARTQTHVRTHGSYWLFRPTFGISLLSRGLGEPKSFTPTTKPQKSPRPSAKGPAS